MKAMGGALLALGCLAACAWAEDIPVQLGRPRPLPAQSPAGVQLASFVAREAVELEKPGAPVLPAPDLPEPSPAPMGRLPDAVPGSPAVHSFSVLNVTGPEETPAPSCKPPPGAAQPHIPQPSPVPYAIESWQRLPDAPAGHEPIDFGGLTDDILGRRHGRFYASTEYLLWWTRGDHVPALVTTGPDPGPTVNNPASLGRPGTVILIGNGTLDPAPYSGFRGTVGYWFDDNHCLGAEVTGFTLPQRSRTLGATSDQFPLLARPFFTINPGPNFGESTEIIARMNQATGAVAVNTASSLWGIEANLRRQLGCGCLFGDWSYRVEALAGFRYLQLEDSLEILESINVLKSVPPASPALPNGGQAFVFDQFKTRNQFYGGQAGLSAEIHKGPWSLTVDGKLAIGGTHQVVDIFGNQLQIDNVLGPSRFVGGLLALPTNIGHYTHNHFAVVPELGLKLGYQVTEHVRLTLGYDFLYWSSVVRPGDQIDRGLDTTRIPNFVSTDQPTGLRRPAPQFNTTDFWAQGLNVGLEIRY
jgi:hypothetical protein